MTPLTKTRPATRTINPNLPRVHVIEIARHRNGICGEPFTVVLFDDLDHHLRMIATIFDTDARAAPRCAVYAIDELMRGNIAFAAGNSWRGDHYADALWPAVEAWHAAKDDNHDTHQRRSATHTGAITRRNEDYMTKYEPVMIAALVAAWGVALMWNLPDVQVRRRDQDGHK